ncbi:unnamed protein product [Ilex paraguariensis]|uniref:Uncharacterized protein n=1 Tax=Ilex paraguariensis TaxID=185542 RepID=A0ABC8TQF1_9AQUA
MVKATAAPQPYEPETQKSQNRNLHSTAGERSVTEGDSIVMDVFRWSRCKKPLPQRLMRSIGIPLPLEHLET